MPSPGLLRSSVAACGLALLALASCDTSSSSHGTKLQTVHEFQFDPTLQEYVVQGDRVAVADVERDLVGSLCSRCHAASVAELKASVHYRIAAPTERVLFPGGGAHGMLDRACGLPATTGLTNFTSDINLGECAKCHVSRYLPAMEGFFASMFGQMGVSDPAGQATQLVDAGLDCLVCHAETYRAVPDGAAFASIAPTAGDGSTSPTAVGSARAARDDGDFDHDGTPDLVIDMDGDGVLDAPLMYDSDGDGMPDTRWATVAQDRSLAALASIGPTTEHTCLRCHDHARTGYKRGTLFVEGHDRHASATTGVFQDVDNRCTVCHTADGHKFVRGHMVGGDLGAADYPPPAPGIGHDPSDPTDIACVSCHDPAALPGPLHTDHHVDSIACETCHIPWGSGITYSLFGHGGQVSFSRNAAGKDTKLVVADMYVAGDKADIDADFEAYKVRPILTWFNGGTSFLAQTLSAMGSPNAKITPFKPMANGMVFDARYFDGVTLQNDAGADYNAHSMYRFYANGTNAEAFSALGMLDMTPDAVRHVTMNDFQSTDPDVQTMALMLIFPDLVYFDKADYGYEHYLTRTGSPFDADLDGIIDPGGNYLFDMLAAANAGLRQFAAFNAPMGFPPDYEWYPSFTDVSQPISMKLPDGSLMKMFLQMQAASLPPGEQQAWLDAVDNYPSFSQVTLGGHGVRPKEEALGASGCIDCHSVSGALAAPLPVGHRISTDLGPMGVVDLPQYQWRYYNVHALIDLGLQTTSEQIVAGGADVDIDGDTAYLRESGTPFVLNWFQPSDPSGYRRADDASALAGTGLTAGDLTWSGGDWMPVLEPVTDLLPTWQVLGLPDTVIW